MKMHPAEIAKEIRSYPFFKSFSDELLLQAATMIRSISYSSGNKILKEGESNKNLYFLRSGRVDVSLMGQPIATLGHAGEVFGEMSVITGNPIFTSISALTDVECFYIQVDDFTHVHPKDNDRLQVLLYRIYCVVLTERLMRTNEKARLFEILNKELHEAQNALERTVGGRVLLVEPDKKQHLPIRMALGSSRLELEIVNNADEAIEALGKSTYDIVLCEENCMRVLEEIEQKKMGVVPVLLTNRDACGNLDVLQGNRFVNYLISRDPEDRSVTIRYVLTALSKLLNKDIFGLEKYLSWGVEVQKRDVTGSMQRDELREEIYSYFKKMGVRSTVLDRVNTVAEELLMNAVYDAPVDIKGNSLYNHMSRKEEIQLETHQQSHLRYASDGLLLAISVKDPFGSLTKEVLVDYLMSCYNGSPGSMNSGKGGAGRGLHQIIENADLTIFNVRKGVRTEVICLFNVDGQKKPTQPTFHYFFT